LSIFALRGCKDLVLESRRIGGAITLLSTVTRGFRSEAAEATPRLALQSFR
jgi:hypothetical protein